MSAINFHSLTLKNDLESVSTSAQSLAEKARTYCHFAERDEFHIFIALVEAINNAVVHGNLEVDSNLREGGVEYERTIEERRHREPFTSRIVTLRAEFSAEFALFQIENEGPGFDVSQIADPTTDENLSKPSGRGLLIMRSFFDRVEFNESGTCLTLVKNVLYPVSETPQTQNLPEMVS